MNRTRVTPGYGVRVQVQPAAGTRLRAALATGEIMIAVTGAHLWAGGELPALPWLAAMSGLVYLVGSLLMRGTFSLGPAALGVGVAQFGLHHLLTAMSPDAGHVHTQLLGEMSPQMLFAHGVGALATWLVWALRRSSLDTILHWSQLLTSPLPTAPRTLAVPGRVAAPISLRAVGDRPRRGPPSRVPIAA